MGKVDKNDEVLKLLKTLVEIQSPTGKEEELKNFVRDYLLDLGYEVIEAEKYLFTKGNPKLVVATHLDTVPIKAPFSTDETFAYGTGVCDAKAGLTAMLLAAKSGINYTLAFFCDEEEDGTGSAEFIKNWKGGKYAIVLEPTNLAIASLHYGSVEVILEVKGELAHGACPEAGKNAIDMAIEAISNLRSLGFLVNPLKISGGGDEYVIPEKCKVKVEVFVPPQALSISKILSSLAFLQNYGKVKVEAVFPGCTSKEVHKLLEKAIKAVRGFVSYTVMRSWTDALNLMQKLDVVVWGPGELSLCHTEKEFISLREVEICRKVLEKLRI